MIQPYDYYFSLTGPMGKVNLQCDKENVGRELLSSTLQDYGAKKAEDTKNSPDFKGVGERAIIALPPHARCLAYIS